MAATTTAGLDPDCKPGDTIDVTTIVMANSPQSSIQLIFRPSDPLPDVVPLDGPPTADVRIDPEYTADDQTQSIEILDLLDTGSTATIHSTGAIYR